MMQECEDVAYLVTYLQRERNMGERPVQPEESPQWLMKTWERFRALVNTRQPGPASAEFLAVQDRFLHSINEAKDITDIDRIEPCASDPRLTLWQGDITALRIDAIVNAANSGMLGCWIPGHYCIDNAIHTYAGVQLRLECAQIMQAQGHEEPVGQAKVTAAYNLPAKHIVHTVGPMVPDDAKPTLAQRKELAQCYLSCLDAAAKRRLKSIAFCCISTGVFGFPQIDGARIAVETVKAWLDAQAAKGEEAAQAAAMRVVFDVYSDEDRRIYEELLA